VFALSLLRRIADNTDRDSPAGRARARRFAFFLALMADLPHPVRLLDVGGTPDYWRRMQAPVDELELTILNRTVDPASDPRLVQGDARSMPQFESNAFDVVFSNSVIEHVGNRADQRAMAEEVRRVGKRYFVQTPNAWFPLEPHFLVPGFQFLPPRVRSVMIQRFDLGHIPRIPDAATADRYVRSIRLLNEKQLRVFFPDARIHRERIFGLTKSLMAVGGW
jgi:hypothetical protein